MSDATATPSLQSHELYHAPHNPWLIAVVATLATFMEVLDTSIANVALPHIAGNLGASVNDSTWVLTSYLVANAIVLPASAWLSGVFGRRNYYIISVAVFAASSLLCGLAPSLEMLVLFRLLQGFGGGGLQPTTQAILVDTFRPSQRGMGMAVYGMTVVVAPVIGPTLGGWITDNYSWRWIFFINVPVGLLATMLSTRFISDPPYIRRKSKELKWRGDFIGLGLFALGLGALQITLDLGDRMDWFNSHFITATAVGSGLAILAGILWELNHPDPMVNIRVLKERNLGLSCLHMLIFGGVLFGTTALLPLLMQTVLGYTAELSGLALSPGGIVIAILMPLVGFMVARIDARWMIIFGIGIVAIALWMMGRFTLDVDFTTIVIARSIQGLGLAFIFVPINTIAYARVAGHERNSASSLMSIARNIGGSVGIGLSTAMLSHSSQLNQTALTRNLTQFDPAYSNTVSRLASHFVKMGGDLDHARLLANGVIEQMVHLQALMIAYVEQFRLLSLAFLALVPVVILMRKRDKDTHVELVAE